MQLSALPPLPSRIALLSGDPIREKLLSGREVSPDDLEIMARSRTLAVRWRGDWSFAATDLATVSLERARRSGNGDRGVSAEVSRAAAWQRMALGQAPASSYGWGQLAYAELALGDKGAAARSLAMSLAVDPYEPRMAAKRVELGGMLYDNLDGAAKFELSHAVRQAWKNDRKSLIIAAKAHESVFRIVVEALATEGDAVVKFHRAVGK